MGFGGSKSAPDVPDLNSLISSQVGGNWGMTGSNNRRTLYGTESPFGETGWFKARNDAGNVIKTKYTDPYTGEKYKAPTYNQRITLSPEEQQKYDLSNQAQIGALGQANKLMGGMGNFGLDDFDFTKSLGEIGGNIFDPNNLDVEPIEARLNELGRKRLDPRLSRELTDIETKLTNQGVRRGTEGWKRAMEEEAFKRNDAYNQLALTGRGQAVSEVMGGQAQQFQQAMLNRGRELGERGQYAGEQFGTQDRNIQYLTQLLQAGQPNMPQFTGSQPGASPYMDYAGAINQNWDQQFKGWEAEQAAKGNMFGGAMSGLAGIFASDERIKDNVKQVGTTQDGLPIYEFSIGDGEMQTGVMAQDVEAVNPGAVVEGPGGVKGVDYPAAVGDGTGTYTVEEGDNIWDIGERLGVDPQAIIAANPEIENPDLIVPGQQLVVPGMAAPGPEAIPMGGGQAAVANALAGGAGPGMVQPGSMPAAPPLDVGMGDPEGLRAAAAAPTPASVWEGQFVQPSPVAPGPQSAESYQTELDRAAEHGVAVPPSQLIDRDMVLQMLMSRGGMGGY